MKKANVYGLALLPPVALLAVLYLWLWGLDSLSTAVEFESPLSVLLVWLVAYPATFAVGIVAHELLHGLSFLYIGGAHRENVTLVGFQRETATPYSACSEPVRARHYRWSVAMPTLILGILPATVGLATGNPWAMFFGLLFILAASGDALILWLLRSVSAEALVEDHPTRAGCYVIESGGQTVDDPA
jgi:hypothetical protein